MSPALGVGVERVCMLSTHGYVDPVPQLGRTDTGGQVVYVLQLARALSSRGVSVDIYTRWFDPSAAQVNPLSNCPEVRVVRIAAGPSEFLPKEQIYPVLPELAQNMVAFIHDNDLGYDLFHGHYVDAGIVTLDVAEDLSAPAFFTAHSIGAWKREQMGGDPEEMEAKFNFKHRIAEELRIFNSVTAHTATTEVQKQKIEKLYGVSANNIAVISPGVDVHRFHPLEPSEEPIEVGLPDRYIFCLSRIDSNKGHDFLLHAFDIVREALPDVHLVIGGGSPNPVGTELEVQAMIAEIIDEKDMHDRVHVLGYMPDEALAASYQGAELFVLPSLFEPFGMTALEAMACATPVVASRLGGIRTVIDSGSNGLLVDPSDSEEFADAMLNLLRDVERGRQLGAAGREVILQRYSWETIAERHLEFYRRFMP